ncbi:biotin--[acetyl-CoA-carboxylase] ligase [Cellulosilyticum sp. I15G10I2]|uniref:biotin--[acetyl-CoA-carboxylase] ligase n=1 Tax=Cellulosilyticum sp. I15G10I2 TaxID=1892843 RepID=UPI00085C8F64|nr:biotin--[acetyl-CoA-carboxylase] ligase [Cellulosilyticum sp. I15G10I2]
MKEKVLAFLKGQDQYVSGEEISSKLGVTRAGVWKNINKLKEDGYHIESITKRGYRLIATPDVITQSEIASIINTKLLGKDIHYYEKVDSTNEVAKTLAREGAAEGTLIMADKQLMGKGRLGKTWDSPSGTGIWMSLILRPHIIPGQASQLTLLAGLNMCEAIRRVTGLDCKIKWPNDIVINGKKVCGILAEMSAEMDGINHIILGIGVNVNIKSFEGELPHATSLYLESGKTYLRRYIVKEFLHLFEADYMHYKDEKSIAGFLKRYRKNCITLHHDIQVVTSEGKYIAYAKDIAEDGALVVIDSDNNEKTIFSGEVSVRGIYGYI